MKQDLFTFEEACDYLDLHWQTLEKLQRERKLTPDVRLAGGGRLYSRSYLDEWKKRWQSQRLTVKEICQLFGITRDTFIHHFRHKRNIQHDGKRGRAMVYNLRKALMVARSEGWIGEYADRSVVNDYVAMGLMNGTWLVWLEREGEIDIKGRFRDRQSALKQFDVTFGEALQQVDLRPV